MKAKFRNIAIAVIGLFTAIYLLLRRKSNKNLMDWPIENPVITSEFGNRTISGKSVYHYGVDLRAAVGTPIINPEAGKVIAIFYDNNGGNQIIVQHDGFKLGYAHLKQLSNTIDAVQIGKTIRKGQGIGVTGSTGNTTGPHLHLTYTDALGIKRNPRDYFKKIA